MSLFGGDTSRSASPYESSRSESLVPPESSPPPRRVVLSPPSGQTSQQDAHDDDSDDDNESHRVQRRNRFKGNPSTWRKHTEDARQIAASLDRIQAADLSAHLYNAHALKSWARLPDQRLKDVKEWHQKESWIKKGKALEFTDAAGERQIEVVPRKRWTAWPLAPHRMDESSNRAGLGLEQDDSGAAAGDELREEMLATFLRIAKENWVRRNQAHLSSIVDTAEGGSSKLANRLKRLRSEESMSTEAYDTAATDSDVEMPDNNTPQDDKDRIEGDPDTATATASGNKRRGPKQQQRSVRAAILADDDKARRLLNSTINYTLTRLDGVAAAIRRSRMNHFGRGAYSDTSGSEFTSDAESTAAESDRRRSSSRTRSKSTTKPNKPRSQKKLPRKEAATNDSPSPSSSSAAAPSDTEQTQSHPPTDLESKERTPRTTNPPYHRPHRGSSTESSLPPGGGDAPSGGQAGLMDWSEVLATASMTGGWPAGALSRTAQRCAALFGETISFRVFDEGLPASKPLPPPVRYTPSTIAAADMIAAVEAQTPARRPYFEAGTLRCPHVDCRAHEKDHDIPYRVVEHVKRAHGYDPRTNDSDNEDRKVGGVHKDGFLQPITLKRGWLSSGKAKAKDGVEEASVRRTRSGGGNGKAEADAED
ncbi:hypothetical protein BU24DRAFT_438850 [Aaosphaeria arxii CBS 175.79]|uniref:Rrn9 domain-containing protein n=1 Tax=Aaosphaeria arxii CBS 175.79 TaxID=1450172 RepID=A0A6A5Y9A0_9PLEO|nr:uncharacterized protein BU24DRAFT_438850 [Aaosphaeria arxii CBS 175.79]KAF2021998.1 hypothetical protein BU24DRAFT_438850 [Aaosphaeria arxii CBS 175.79]